MSKTTIEWTDVTWNPTRGCRKISPGCKHCYAETFAERWRGVPGNAYEQGFDPRVVPGKMMEPITWAKPRVVFVNSMSDLFLDDFPDEVPKRVWGTMTAADWHVYQVLTKRADRMRLVIGDWDGYVPPEHIWLGVSVENVAYGVPRIEHLRRTPAAVRFLSIEPLLGDLGDIDLYDIDWAIVGGESGVGARPMERSWVLRLRDQCAEQSVPFFFKQWGGVRKKNAGRVLDGRTHDDMPPLRRKEYPGRAEARRRANELERAWSR